MACQEGSGSRMQTYERPKTLGSHEQMPPVPYGDLTISFTSDNDEWFRDEFEDLFVQLSNFVDTFFGEFGDIRPDTGLSPWIVMHSEFVRYSMMVAVPDDNHGDWNQILLKRNERWYLIMGILARVLEAKVFGELLFGGSKSQKQQLEAPERSSIEAEGFGRTEHRASNIKAILGDRPIPNFHIDVTRLSKQIMMLLHPLSKFLKDVAERDEETIIPDEDQFRNIHDIVAMAAHLSIRIRVSPTIFYFHSERPGNPYDPEDQIDMDYPAYAASKSAVTEPRKNQRSHSNKYCALVRFAIWPSIRRYSARVAGRGYETDGFRIYTISKSRVVYYWGLNESDGRVSVGLQTFIKLQRRQRQSMIANVAENTINIFRTIFGRAKERTWIYTLAVVVAASAYFVVRDFRNGKNSFGWQ